jgi:leader peptidase (prepilin peptidase)/N-methyltransferase
MLDNIPVLSYLILQGKCRSCGQGFSAIYPTIEVITAILFTAAYLRFGLTWDFLIFAIVIPTLVVITVIDIEHQIIPDLITLPGIVFGLIAGSYLNGWQTSLIGFAVGGGSFLLISEIYYRLRGNVGMGGGDIKYIAAAGALLGWQNIIVVIFLAAFSGALIGMIGMGFKKLGFLSKIPFGPFLAVGTLAAIFYGDEIINLYLGMVIVEK